MRIRSLTLAAALGISALSIGTLQAQGGPALPGQVDASRIAAGTYEADSGHSLIGWRVNYFGFNDYFGIFGSVAGTLEIDPANPEAAKVDITIPIGAVTTASEGLTNHLLRAGKDGGAPDFFGPEAEPAHFVSTSVEKTGDTTANITGDLTLNGVTKQVVVAAEFTGAGTHLMTQKATIGFQGSATVKRSDFGIGYALPMVSDDVELNISIAFRK